MRLLLEVVGWILAGIGAYFIFDNDPMFYHYIILGVGIVIIIFTLPKNLRKRKK